MRAVKQLHFFFFYFYYYPICEVHYFLTFNSDFTSFLVSLVPQNNQCLCGKPDFSTFRLGKQEIGIETLSDFFLPSTPSDVRHRGLLVTLLSNSSWVMAWSEKILLVNKWRTVFWDDRNLISERRSPFCIIFAVTRAALCHLIFERSEARIFYNSGYFSPKFASKLPKVPQANSFARGLFQSFEAQLWTPITWFCLNFQLLLLKFSSWNVNIPIIKSADVKM